MTQIFSAADRETLRTTLLETARADTRIVGAAHLGSFALRRHDRWSDIDLALAYSTDDCEQLVDEWTGQMYGRYSAVDHYDIRHMDGFYRAFLLSNTLQVDLSFWPHQEFRPLGAAFDLVFGEALPIQRGGDNPTFEHGIGLVWLHALHVRSALARDRAREAEQMLAGMRQHGLVQACIRNGLPAQDGRGIDRLAPQIRKAWEEAIPASMVVVEIRRAFGVAAQLLIAEIEDTSSPRGQRLASALMALTEAPSAGC